MLLHCDQLKLLFNNLFQGSQKTILVGGSCEPLYLPQNDHQPFNQILFRHDYYSSALHEIAHWCIAGPKRKKMHDYGYWYQPDGRSMLEQELFEQVEAKPQAIEWIFSVAVGIKFYVSADNVSGMAQVTENFKLNIYQHVLNYLMNGLPRDAEQFKNSLLDFYQRRPLFHNSLFLLEEL